MTAHGTVIALGGGDGEGAGPGGIAVPFIRCDAGGARPPTGGQKAGTPGPGGDRTPVTAGAASCAAGLLVQRGGGAGEILPLPGLDGVTPAWQVEFTAATADVNSNGTADLWIGYRIAGNATDAYHVAAFALPDLRLMWHGVVSGGRGEPRCEGALYPADADCDGDGDLVLVRRCGPPRCLADDGAACAPGEVTAETEIHLWQDGGYAARPANTAR
jgi:hypothetical protein